VSALEDKVSNKKFSEEAVATVSKIINDAILERNNSFIKDKEQLENEKAELAKAAEENSEAVKQLQQELAEATDRVSELEQGQKQSEAIARFDSRMSMIEEIYELDDESRKIVAHELKDIDETEEALATFQEKLSVVLRHQNKEFIAKQEEEFNSKLAEAVEKRIAELKSENSSEDEAVEEALDSISNESEVVANNNAESSEEEVSLKQKFQEAFSEENLTINY
jgi:DNA repair exonuclease SbcCD ATPase subunit